ncbi:TonB-dependent receptor [Hyphomicrobium sp.]|uniref:TonB-dependent receptor family protein n=1 Tax=Hyphomicrobium sp. TaxID=82 RepID=UPI002CD6B7D3|nr:TonB-dependent receptor [Hyphomicrobium sp.]HVZ05007.1 TonB-dependent receptor [Hyphomicrobium sp.]
MLFQSNRPEAVHWAYLPTRKSIAFVTHGVALLLSAQMAHAQEAGSPNALKLPDVTVQQDQKTSAPKIARKSKTKAKRKVAEKRTAPPTAPPKPSVRPIEMVTPSPLPSSPLSATPLIGNPGTPSHAVASVPGASGAGAQTATGIDMTRFDNTPVFSVSDVLHEVPGVSLKQGNGPRDMGISIRGSNARNGYGIRNIVVLDDGFPVTQPDGLSRSDLIDPHAYAGIDVWRGPSSALFGNYATGGAINFRTWPGGVVDGVEYGIDVGSFNYLNNYVIGGAKGSNWEGSIFTSDVRGDGYFEYGSFNTQTINALLTYKPTASDTITLKAINNDLYTQLPFRTSLRDFRLNPYQKGCKTAATAAEGCETLNYSPGYGAPVAQTAEQAGANRNDRRTLGGFRWDHVFNADTSSQVQFVIDDRNINQPTGTTGSIGDYLSYNFSGGLTNRSTFAGLPTLAYLGAFWNYLPVDGQTYFIAPGGNARLGKLQSVQRGSTMNFGARVREEVKLTNEFAVVAGATVERTSLDGSQTGFTYDVDGNVATTRNVSANRDLTNFAPELGVVYTPSREWQLRARVGTGYGTPQFSNLFVTPDGEPGNNTELKSQRNVGFDVGGDWRPVSGVTLSLTGFYEFFNNELVSQSAGPGLMNFTFNAPASEHRGIEAAANVIFGEGWRWTASYLFNDQVYTDYDELVSGASEAVSRAGNKIPGVSPGEVTTRLSYDQPDGPFRGLGTYVEYEWHDGFYMENANLLTAPGYQLVNLNVHYTKDFDTGPVRSLMAYFEIRNLFDETYISAANNISDRAGYTADDLAGIAGSIYAGAPRTYYGGMKVRF